MACPARPEFRPASPREPTVLPRVSRYRRKTPRRRRIPASCFPASWPRFAAVALIGWIMLTTGAKIESAEAEGGATTKATLERASAIEMPSERKLSVEPAGYR